MHDVQHIQPCRLHPGPELTYSSCKAPEGASSFGKSCQIWLEKATGCNSPQGERAVWEHTSIQCHIFCTVAASHLDKAGRSASQWAVHVGYPEHDSSSSRYYKGLTTTAGVAKVPPFSLPSPTNEFISPANEQWETGLLLASY